MAILESRTKTGISWVKESIALFSQSPRRWLLLALAYLGIFMMLPAIKGLEIIGLFTVLLWPAFIAFAVMLYKNADLKQTQTNVEVWTKLKPYLPQLLLTGLICLVYATLVGMLIGGDWQSLAGIAAKNQRMTDAQAALLMQKMLPFVVKTGLLLLPLLVATWFSPMLVAMNNYPAIKAMKSSIAGCLQHAIAMIAAWLLLSGAIILIMLVLGILLTLLGMLIPPIAQLLTPALILIAMLVATALMLAFQYVSYRDIFRAASQA